MHHPILCLVELFTVSSLKVRLKLHISFNFMSNTFLVSVDALMSQNIYVCAIKLFTWISWDNFINSYFRRIISIISILIHFNFLKAWKWELTFLFDSYQFIVNKTYWSFIANLNLYLIGYLSFMNLNLHFVSQVALR